MFERRIPEWLRHAPAPSMRGFAMLAGAEAVEPALLDDVLNSVVDAVQAAS